MVPNKSNFVVHYEYPHVPSFAEDFAGALYFTPQTPEQVVMNFGLSSPVDEGDFLLVDHPVLDPLLETPINVDDGHSHQSFEMPMASPSSVSSAPENLSWDLVEPAPGKSAWDLSGLHPDSCSISERRNSEPLNCSSASTPKAQSQGKLTLS